MPAQAWYTLKRARGTAFGDRPLPGGTVQRFPTDSPGRVRAALAVAAAVEGGAGAKVETG